MTAPTDLTLFRDARRVIDPREQAALTALAETARDLIPGIRDTHPHLTLDQARLLAARAASRKGPQ